MIRATKCLTTALLLASAAHAQQQRPRTPGDTLRSPVIADGNVTFQLYAPKATEVVLRSEGPAPFANKPLTKSEAGVWSLAMPVPADLYIYWYEVDGLPVADPKNNRPRVNMSTVRNLLEVPGQASAFFAERDVPHGLVSTVWYQSTSLGVARRMQVYTPPGYLTGTTRYPVFYLLHGAGDDDQAWLMAGRANFILDNLIASGRAKPMIVVMPAGHTPRPGGMFGPAGSRDPFIDDFTKDVMPYVEKNYRLLPGRDNRAIAGLSMGGNHTLAIALPNLDKFSQVGVFSSGFLGQGGADSVAKQYQAVLSDAKTNGQLKLFWLATGKDDFILNQTKATLAVFDRNNIKYTYKETDGGHTWPNWRAYLAEFAPKLFGTSTAMTGPAPNGWRWSGSSLVSTQKYRDFALDVDFKVGSDDADGGILLRADAAGDPKSGYEVAIKQYAGNNPYDAFAHITGALDGVAAPTRPAAKAVGQWNHYRIEARGQRYRVYLNGELVNDYFGTRNREGTITLQSTDTSAVAYRNARVTSLAAGPEKLGDAFTKLGTKPIRVLVVTATHGFRHTEAIDASREVLPELARTTEIRFDWSDSAGAINAENLKKYDVLFINNATLRGAPADTSAAAVAATRAQRVKDPLTLEQQRALDAWVRAGHGVVLSHSGLDAMYGVASYREMVGGGQFEMHPWIEPVHVVVDDKASASTKQFGEPLWVRDEIYVLDTSPRGTSHVLLSLDKASAGEPNVPGPRPVRVSPGVARSDHPLSWIRKHGDGRVFATLLGHFGDVWHRPDYLQHIAQGIRIAAGTVPADFSVR